MQSKVASCTSTANISSTERHGRERKDQGGDREVHPGAEQDKNKYELLREEKNDMEMEFEERSSTLRKLTCIDCNSARRNSKNRL